MADEFPRESAPQPKPATPTGPQVSRRELLIGAGALGAGVALGAALTRILPGGREQSLTAYPRARVASVSELRVGQPLAFEYPSAGQASYLIKLGRPALDGAGPAGDIVAYSAICTHMGCSLANRYKSQYAMLGPCPCHLSAFDLALGGMPVAGAATENLPQLDLTVDHQGAIYAQGVWGVIYGYENNLQSPRS